MRFNSEMSLEQVNSAIAAADPDTIVYFERGEYPAGIEFRNRQGMVVTADGPVTMRDILIEGCNRIRVSDLTFREVAGGIRVRKSSVVTIGHIRGKDCAAVIRADEVSHLTIEAVRSEDCELLADVSNSQNITVAACNAQKNAGLWRFENCENVIGADNRAFGSTGIPVVLINVNGVVMDRDIILDCQGESAYRVSGESQGVFINPVEIGISAEKAKAACVTADGSRVTFECQTALPASLKAVSNDAGKTVKSVELPAVASADVTGSSVDPAPAVEEINP